MGWWVKETKFGFWQEEEISPFASVHTSSGSSSLVLVVWVRAVILTSLGCEYWAYTRMEL